MTEMVIDQRRRDLRGGLAVGRVLPFARHRMVGPFIFLDHMGPLDLEPGIDRSLDVRPHPHIGLSTVTYLFAGEEMHRDSLGSEMAVRSQEVNWMTAGRGITHSERFERARARRPPAWDPGLGRASHRSRGDRSLLLAPFRTRPSEERGMPLARSGAGSRPKVGNPVRKRVRVAGQYAPGQGRRSHRKGRWPEVGIRCRNGGWG